MGKLLFCIFLLLLIGQLIQCQKRGVQIRVTSKGFSYAMRISMGILVKDISGKSLKEYHGRDGKTEFWVRNIKINSMSVGSGSYLMPSAGRGMVASVSGINMRVTAQIRYKTKLGWFKISDTVNVNAAASNVQFRMTLAIGRRSDGRPSLTSRSCSSSVGNLRLRFSRSKVSWLYNLFSRFLEGKLKKQLARVICDSAKKAIRERGDTELRTFPVKKNIDRWATLDYSMTTNPRFTNSYMDVFLKGEFVSRSHPKHSLLPIPDFSTSSDASKMAYFWITEYTINTAGEVYHSTGRLSITVKPSDAKISKVIKSILNTQRFKFLIPELFRKFPNRPMRVKIHSYKPPSVSVKHGEIFMNIYASLTFQVVLKSGSAIDVFSVLTDIKTGGSLSVVNGKVIGHLIPKDLKLNLKMGKSVVGPVSIPLNNPFIKVIVKGAVIKSIQPLLERGIPIPNIGDVDLVDSKITLMKGVIRIGTDCKFRQ